MIPGLYSYLQLTKPRVMLLVIAGGLTALLLEGSMLGRPFDLIIFLFGLYLTGGSANALNQYFERDIDSFMERTKNRRPLPQKQIQPSQALVFSILIGTAGVATMTVAFNLLTGTLALFTILFYSLFYTLWLKPHTDQNIVIGGVAGAMSPVGAWTAATGTMTVTPWILFLIIFLWTPPHFWSLAIRYKNDYQKVNLPMLPAVRGESATLRQIFYYSVALFVASLLPLLSGSGWIYGIPAMALGLVYITLAYGAKKNPGKYSTRGLFKYSIIYLALIFALLIIDRIAP